ncbi:MerR family regulatory protein [Actinokineospora alba]|uniref:MerR family regulatory protein n=1 Tax=Actinokineospora alba TaxID=504798 RepID=A0A1H0NSE4_9PSEU|nr:MerR-like DNA binding protein [Actinokineospora alba]SDH87649.1 MerR family regulatory protein [Actinokineospora alba]SDO95682.1 MerR family regulatory protein [Actinokineospora alba]
MTAARPASDGWNIGAVLQRLRPEFPDVTISKIRFLEAEGLIRPDRSPAGYRRFTGDDVERLRFVLAAQRDHYLPLRVIKDQLEQADRGGAARPLTVAVERIDPDEFAAGSDSRLTRDDVLRQAGVAGVLLDDLEQYGLVAAGSDGFYDGDAVQIARLASGLADYGIEPRHLRAFRAAADREVGLMEQVVAPMYRQRDPAARDRADSIARELGALSVGLHSLLVKAGLRRITGR